MSWRFYRFSAVAALSLCVWACSTSERLPELSERIADVSLPPSLPAPRDGSDVSEGTTHFPGRPAQERLTSTGRSKIISDDRLRTEVLAAIVDDPAVDPFQFRYRVEDSEVEILGQGSARQKNRVEETVRRVRGVREVENHVKTTLDSGDDESPSARKVFEPKSDSEIESAVHELLEDGQTAFRLIQTQVRDGVVRLKGEVQSLRTRLLLEEGIRDIPGVRSVSNGIEVRLKYLRDNRILARDVRTALRLDPRLPSDRIQVLANDGVVELSGAVRSPWEKERAARMSSEVWGVSEVKNRIQVATDKRRSMPGFETGNG